MKPVGLPEVNEIDIIKLLIILLLVCFACYPISDLKKPMGYATLLKPLLVANINQFPIISSYPLMLFLYPIGTQIRLINTKQ